jgi:hypothetical protein
MGTNFVFNFRVYVRKKMYLFVKFSGKVANRLSKNPRRSILTAEKVADADKSIVDTEKSLNGMISNVFSNLKALTIFKQTCLGHGMIKGHRHCDSKFLNRNLIFTKFRIS